MHLFCVRFRRFVPYRICKSVSPFSIGIFCNRCLKLDMHYSQYKKQKLRRRLCASDIVQKSLIQNTLNKTSVLLRKQISHWAQLILLTLLTSMIPFSMILYTLSLFTGIPVFYGIHVTVYYVYKFTFQEVRNDNVLII